MQLLKKRTIKTDHSSIGAFLVDGVFECYGLEPTDRGLTHDMTEAEIAKIKIDGKTAVPTGTYEVVKYFSPVHQVWLARVVGIKCFDFIEIHSGNKPVDTKGCLLPGTDIAADFVGNSKIAVAAFEKKFFAAIDRGERVFITYE